MNEVQRRMLRVVWWVLALIGLVEVGRVVGAAVSYMLERVAATGAAWWWL